MPDLRSLIVDAATEIVTEGTKSYFNTRINPESAQKIRMKVITPENNCPYCQIIDHLATINTYMSQIRRDPHMADADEQITKLCGMVLLADKHSHEGR